MVRRLIGDKAQSSRAIRLYLRGHGLCLTIPRTRGEHRTSLFDRHLYRQRKKIECLINRPKQSRRMAMRDETRAANDQAMLCVATILLWL
jgi:hypothetical protein